MDFNFDSIFKQYDVNHFFIQKDYYDIFSGFNTQAL